MAEKISQVERFVYVENKIYLKEKKQRIKGKCVALYCRKNTWHQSEKFCSRCKMRLWRARNPIKNLYTRLKHSAKRRGIPFHLELKEFTEWILRTPYLLGRGIYGNCYHIDRIRNYEGYSINNIQILTCSENVKKENEDDYPF